MKKLLLSSLGLMTIANSFAQFNTVWPAPAVTNTSNATNVGYVGLGIHPLSTSTNLPSFNFQVHGTTDYIVTNSVPGVIEPAPPVNYGKTSRIGLTSKHHPTKNPM